jgi:hypothetical protein
MDAIKKHQTLTFQKAHSNAPQSDESAAVWWANWARDHREQIEAYNKDVAENGVWSDGLRTF